MSSLPLHRSLLRSARRPGWICQQCSYSARAKRREQGKVTPARTRFAPSPTGYLHLGSLRTALFNYLIAKSTGGQFILRIEDTDKKRTVEGAEDALYEVMRWAGLEFNEGPGVGGPCGPYRQSERAQIHRDHADILLDSGQAYRCFCSQQRLRELAQRRGQIGQAQDYDRLCESIPSPEAERRAAAGQPYVVRLLAPETYPPIHDELYGEIKYGKTQFKHGEPSFEDPILLKSDGQPTYHLANVVDDHLMKITHVIRGLEWMPSTPKHVLMYQAFNWEPPKFVHVGLLQNEAGAKLSKRTDDISVANYREKGYLSEALINFVVLLGWHNKDKSDIFSMEELVQKFSISDMSTGNTMVSFPKLDFFQKAHISRIHEARSTAPHHYNAAFDPLIKGVARELFNKYQSPPPNDRIRACIESDVKNFVLPSKFVDEHMYYFKSRMDYFKPEAIELRKTWTVEEAKLGEVFLTELAKEYEDLPQDLVWDKSTIEAPIKRVETDRFPGGAKFMYRIIRYALTGVASGPGIYDVMRLLGRETCVKRLANRRLFYTAEEQAKIAHNRELYKIRPKIHKNVVD